jgi:hypothetical protein
MAAPRPLLVLALPAAILVLATFYASVNAREERATEPSPARSAKTEARPDSGPAVRRQPARRADRPKPKSAPRSALPRMPRRVTAALAARRTVVIFFSQPAGVDDAATAKAVARLRARGGATVVSERIDRLVAYRDLVAASGVSRAPAIVIVGPDRRTRLVEGYVDAETLLQQVADAKR